MSHSQLNLCGFILSDYYGKIVEKVGVNVAQNGLSNIRLIAKKSGLSVKEVSDIKGFCNTATIDH